MESIKRWTKRLAWAMTALVAVSAMLWGASRALYPNAEQRRATALMESGGPQPGRNAFSLAWTLARAVPEEQMHAVVEEDARMLRSMPAIPEQEEFGAWNFQSAATRYPDLTPSPEDGDLFCRNDAAECLNRVRADPDGYRALIGRNRELLDRIATLADYGHYRTLVPLYINLPMPAWTPAGYLATRHAVLFAEGRIDDALAANCRMIDGWRRISANSDTLLTRLLGASMATRRHGALLAEMLAELPPGHPLPEICDRALAPPEPDELWLCPAMRGEYRIIANTNEALDEGGYPGDGLFDRIQSLLAFDAEATSAITAQNFAAMCSETELERIAADGPVAASKPPVRIVSLQCLGNFVGCVLSGISAPAYTQYRLQILDDGARYRLLGTLAWLHAQAPMPGGPGQTLADRLAARPGALKSPARELHIAGDGRSLELPLYRPVEVAKEFWRVPLPGSRTAMTPVSGNGSDSVRSE